MSDNKYYIDTNTLARRLLPSFLATRQLVLDWARLLLWPLQYVNGLFVAYMDTTRFNLMVSSQIIVLNYVLNIKFTGRSISGIYIEEPEYGKPFWFGYYAAEHIAMLGYGHFASEHALLQGYGFYAEEYESDIDYYVVIPAHLGFTDEQNNQVLDYVKNYKLAQMRIAIKVI